MDASNFTHNVSNNFAEECANLCRAKNRENGVLNSSNYKARALSSKLTKRYYHVHRQEQNNHCRIAKTIRGWLNTKEVKSGIMYHHNFRADP